MQPERSNILYVDDEQGNLNAFRATYKWDYQVHIAKSGAEGLEILAQHPIQLVISDQNMPQMNGIAFLKKVTERYPDVIKILLTAYGDKEVVIAAINECGIFHYLDKPWDETELQLVVNRGLEAFKLKRRNQELIQELEQRVRERTAELQNRNEEIELMNDTLVTHNQQLNELIREKNGIIGVVAHDLQAPLRRIGGLAELIKMTPMPPQEQQYFQLLIKEVEEGKRLVSNILFAERMEEGREASPLEAMDIRPLAPAVVQKYEAQAAKKGIHLTTETAAQPLVVLANADFVSRVLDNLVSNAVKFSPENRDSQVFVRLARENGHVKIQVQDQGPGFSPEDKEKMFKRFQKLSAAPTGGESSTGLGLSIIKALVEKMDGRVSVESQVNQGATFTVLLPAI
ncbi:MAG: hybrid sensor histidine kinase/response regulator [Bernardetiaceae bacterium]|jgi:signal transduction histidine kinase|nr:hybrid sensor histidine kinase/response regulator [Bernardetiaceae bacterium]